MPAGRREAWKTFEVRVTEVRGMSPIRASVRLVALGHVTTPAQYRPRVVWEGIVGHRIDGQSMSEEEAAEHAAQALRAAYPGLF